MQGTIIGAKVILLLYIEISLLLNFIQYLFCCSASSINPVEDQITVLLDTEEIFHENTSNEADKDDFMSSDDVDEIFDEEKDGKSRFTEW